MICYRWDWQTAKHIANIEAWEEYSWSFSWNSAK